MTAQLKSLAGQRISEGRRRMLTESGTLYAAYSRGKCWIKIGFTLDLNRRLDGLNHHFKSLAPFSVIGKAAAVYKSERQMHRILWPFRCNRVGLSRELYLAIPEVEEIVKAAFANGSRPPLPLEDVHVAAMAAIRTVNSDGMRDGIRHVYELFARNGYLEAIE